MPSTPTFAWPYPAGTDADDVPYWMQQALDAIEATLSAAWTAFTPTWGGFTSTPTTVARYRQIGKTVQYRINAVMTAAPTGNVSVSLPVAALATSANSQIFGLLHAKDASAGTYWQGLALQDGGGGSVSSLRLMLPASSTNTAMTQMAAAVPSPWASGDGISIYGEYEVA